MLNEDQYLKIKRNWDRLAKPLDALGYFEDTLSRMGAILMDEKIEISPAVLAVLIADNGIINEGVSQSDHKVTTSVAKALGRRNSSVCHMARQAGVEVYPYNVGMKEEISVVDNRYFITQGTKNFCVEPAMSDEETKKAIGNGRQIARELSAKGFRTILLGEMGIGNTTTSTAVIASIMKLSAEKLCGRGSGLSNEAFSRKIKVIDDAIDKYGLYEADMLKILSTVGGLDIAVMTGIILECAVIGIPVILDGLITAAAALAAVKIDERAKDVVFFSHKGREKGIATVSDELGQCPVIDGNMALGEGTGAVMYYGCLLNALALYKGNTSFEDIEVEQYKRMT